MRRARTTLMKCFGFNSTWKRRGRERGSRGSSEQRIFICIVSSTTDRVYENGMKSYLEVFFFSLSLFSNVDLNELIRASDYE